MAAIGKNAAESAPQNVYNSVTGMIGEWIRQGTDGFIATQKILLDLAAQQNALALTVIRERLGFAPTSSKTLADFTSTGIKNMKNLMEAERVILDIVASQSSIIAEGLMPAVKGTPAEGLAEVVRQGLDTFVGAQRQFIDILEAQAEGALNEFGEGKRFDTARLADLARDGMRNFLHSQKKFLDIVEEQLTITKGPAGKTSKSGRKSVDVFETAKKSVNALIDAQQRLLDLASDQINVDVKFAREMFSVEAGPTTTLADLARKSVDSFVAAQKALAELAAKPRKTEEAAGEQTIHLHAAAS